MTAAFLLFLVMADPCGRLKSLTIQDAAVTSAEMIGATAGLPAYCRATLRRKAGARFRDPCRNLAARVRVLEWQVRRDRQRRILQRTELSRNAERTQARLRDRGERYRTRGR